MNERPFPDLTLSEGDLRDIEICRRLKPEDRLRVAFFLSEVSRRMAVEIVDRDFPGLEPLPRAWKIIEHNTEKHIPELRALNVEPYADHVGLADEWARLKRELAID